MSNAKFYEGEYPESNTSEKKIAEILKKFSSNWSIFHSVKVHDPETEKNSPNKIPDICPAMAPIVSQSPP